MVKSDYMLSQNYIAGQDRGLVIKRNLTLEDARAIAIKMLRSKKDDYLVMQIWEPSVVDPKAEGMPHPDCELVEEIDYSQSIFSY